MILALTGLAITCTGLSLIALGGVIVWREEETRRRRSAKRGEVAETVKAFSEVIGALAEHPIGLRLVLIGVLLLALGAAVSSAAALI